MKRVTNNESQCKATAEVPRRHRACEPEPDVASTRIPTPAPRPKRLRGGAATLAAYKGHRGPVTLEAVLRQIPQELKGRLTGHELGLVMSAVNAAYHSGRASHGGIDLCDDLVWLPWGQSDTGQGEGTLIPISALATIKVEHGEQGTRYVMDYTESTSPCVAEGGQTCATPKS